MPTSNNCKEEREAKEDEGMAIEITPVEGADAVTIGAGSELLRLEHRHGRFLTGKERKIG